MTCFQSITPCLRIYEMFSTLSRCIATNANEKAIILLVDTLPLQGNNQPFPKLVAKKFIAWP